MSDQSSDGAARYEVVISANNGMEKEHAELIRKQLINDGVLEPAVSVREVDQ